MARKVFRKISGVLINTCRDHGVWLDPGELVQIRCFIANGGLQDYQDREIMKNKEEIQHLASKLDDVKFMQRVLHFWNIKYWIFRNL